MGNEQADLVTRVAADKGTILHQCIEDHLSGKTVDVRSLMPSSREQFLGIRPTLDRITDVRALEIQLYSNELSSAGRCDTIARFDGVPSIIDYKNSTREKDPDKIVGYRIQTAVYAHMYMELTGETINRRVILIQSNGSPTQVVIEDTDPVKYIEIFKLLRGKIT